MFRVSEFQVFQSGDFGLWEVSRPILGGLEVLQVCYIRVTYGYSKSP